jgi:hypothetical protein
MRKAYTHIISLGSNCQTRWHLQRFMRKQIRRGPDESRTFPAPAVHAATPLDNDYLIMVPVNHDPWPGDAKSWGNALRAIDVALADPAQAA